MLRILIADDHDIVRKGLRELIEARHDWMVCAEASDGQQAQELAIRERPDVAIFDVSLPLIGGIALTRRLQHAAPDTRVMLFTLHDDEETISDGVAAGAKGYILKTDSEAVVEAAIAALGAKRAYFSPMVSELLLSATVEKRQGSRLASFTIRELEVAQLIAEGHTNKQVAALLSISIKTVETHRGAAMRKADVRSAAEFVRFAIKNNLIQA